MTDTINDTPSLRFAIDKTLCSGHGRCYTLAPQWFDADDVGYAEVKDGPIPVAQRDRMEEIVTACPEGALTITEAPVPATGGTA